MTHRPKKNVLLLTNVLPHYREAIYRELADSDPDIEYTFASDPVSFLPNLKVIDPARKDLPPEQGGFRWRFVRNHFLRGNKAFWQSGALRLAADGRYDAIIFLGQWNCISTWLAAPLARLTGKRVLSWGHGFLKPRKRGRLITAVRRAFHRLFSANMFYSHGARNNAILLGLDPERLYVIFNSLDYDRQCEIRETIADADRRRLRAKLFREPESPVILWIGRLTPQKKLGVLVETARRLADEDLPVNVLMIGDGPERPGLQRQAEELDVADRICFYGACHAEQEVGPLISASDLCAAPGEIGLTCMHALVYGTPCITHDNPEAQMPEFEAIVPGRSGVLYRHGDSDDFATKVKQWLSQDRDREQIRQDCYRIIDEYYNPHVQQRIINQAVRGVPPSQVDMGIEVFCPEMAKKQ